MNDEMRSERFIPHQEDFDLAISSGLLGNDFRTPETEGLYPEDREPRSPVVNVSVFPRLEGAPTVCSPRSEAIVNKFAKRR